MVAYLFGKHWSGHEFVRVFIYGSGRWVLFHAISEEQHAQCLVGMKDHEGRLSLIV